MSLLMDALKRAEEAKRQAQSSATTSAGGLEFDEKAAKDLNLVSTSVPLDLVLEPDLTAAAHQPLPDIPQNLEALDRQFLDSVPPPQSRPAQTASNANPSTGPTPAFNSTAKPLTHAQLAAKAAFEAKQPARGTPVFFVTVAIITVIAVACIGLYFWLQLQPKSGLLPAKSAVPQAAGPGLATQSPAIAPGPAVTQAESRTQQSVKPAQKDEAREAPLLMPPARPPAIQGKKRSALDELSGEPGGIRFRSSQPGMDPALMRGFELYQSGDRGGAKVAYEQALKNDANNLDALHGLGVLALQNRQVEEAEYYFQRALTLDPRDAVARAGLAALRNQSDPTNTESRLNSLLAEQPNSSQLNFALGNLLAASARWAEAQQAYFKAMAAEPDNPDILFNLAVSLDHLHQTKVAADYYRKAVAAAANRPYQFDPGRANERIRALQP